MLIFHIKFFQVLAYSSEVIERIVAAIKHLAERKLSLRRHNELLGLSPIGTTWEHWSYWSSWIHSLQPIITIEKCSQCNLFHLRFEMNRSTS